MQNNTTLRQAARYTLFFGTVITLTMVMLTSLWLQRTIFNTERFTTIATTAITSESSRQAIGQQVATRIFEDRPLLQSTVQPRLANLISNILGTDLAQTGIEKGVQQLQILVTTEQKPPVVLNLTSIKDTVVKIQEAIGTNPEERRVDVSKIPDEIMVIDTTKIPNYYRASIAVVWLGPLSLIVIIALLGTWVYRGRSVLLHRLRIVGATIVGSAAVALLVGPLTKPVVLGIAENAPGQTVLGNLYSGFIGPFNQQAIVLAVGGALLIAGTYFVPYAVRAIRQHKDKTPTIKKANKKS